MAVWIVDIIKISKLIIKLRYHTLRGNGGPK